jgi:hypothetical protein
MSERHEEPHYEIRVRGVLGDSLLGAFLGLDAHVDDGDTVLIGRLPDQAALHGVLAQLQAVNVELIEIRRRTSPVRERPDRRRCRRPPGGVSDMPERTDRSR